VKLKNKMEKQDPPLNISPKMNKQIESIKNMANSKIKISHNANKSQKRILCIKSAKVLTIQPHETEIIFIKSHTALNQANFIFTPSAEKPDIIKNMHLQESMINSNTEWIPLHNTSHDAVTIPPNTILGHAVELNEYEIAKPDSLDLDIDAVTIY